MLEELGQGAMGTVFLAADRTLGRLVAIKVVSPEAAAGVGTAALLTEIGFVARLQHPNILPLFDAGEFADHPYYVMPFVREGSLRRVLAQRGRLGVAETIALSTGIARGLSYAHERQILHCDVKPENILIQDGHCSVMDFGIARKLRSDVSEWRLRASGPRLLRRDAGIRQSRASRGIGGGPTVDVYSLACVVFEMLSGHAPFGGTTTEEIVSKRFHGTSSRAHRPPPMFAPQRPPSCGGRSPSIRPSGQRVRGLRRGARPFQFPRRERQETRPGQPPSHLRPWTPLPSRIARPGGGSISPVSPPMFVSPLDCSPEAGGLRLVWS